MIIGHCTPSLADELILPHPSQQIVFARNDTNNHGANTARETPC